RGGDCFVALRAPRNDRGYLPCECCHCERSEAISPPRRGSVSSAPRQPHDISAIKTSPSAGSVPEAISGPRFSLIQGISFCVELSATALFVNSDNATMLSSPQATR